ncbi:MAG: hypothetical protein LBK99_24165 [Opitutaceae bacterium]|nr:hypothetical protein [Opitutaceae bacterium]
MIAKANDGGDFDPCPEYTGQAVCVDVTELKKMPSKFGERETFKFVFEVAEKKKNGTPFCVWSFPYTLSVSEKANLRKFLRTWLGRDLTKAEIEQGFDVEQMVGRPAFLVVGHETKDNQTYANIIACTPDKSTTPLKPSGKFVRWRDRKDKAGSGSSYSHAEQPGEVADDSDWRKVKIHVGRHKGIDLGDLDLEAVKKLIENWLPDAKALEKPKADDKRLIAALEQVQAELADAEAQKPEDDDVPY